MRSKSALFVIFALLSASAVARADSGPAAVGFAPGPFALKDTLGNLHSSSDYAKQKALVVVFLGVECPLAKLYAPRLEELAKRYASRGVTLLAIDSNAQDSLAEMINFGRVHGMTVPFLRDSGNGVADQFQAERTPEAFVLDAQGTVRYRGRIDDQYGFQRGVGYQRPQVEHEDLAAAIECVVDGRPIEVAVTRAPGCLIGRVSRGEAKTEVTYSREVARIFQNHCVSCHREGEIAPFALTNYDEVVGWAPMIAEVVREGRMPPWHADPQHGDFANDARLSDRDRQQLLEWADNGTPQGDPSDLPAPRQFTTGWQIPQPDQVVAMSDKPFLVPAEGKVEYQHFLVDPGFAEDKWIKAAECRPGNRAVVHHIIVFIIPPGQTSTAEKEGMSMRELLAGTAPGNPPTVMPEGMAKRVRAGSKFLFQMHYTANGSAQEDLSTLGLVFADPKDVTRNVRTDLAINFGFRVPAGADNYEVESSKKFRQDSLLISLMPHMHLRGKSFRYTLEYPDGRKEILLDIPRYDFNWQNTYYLKEPKFVPKGSRMHCVAHFDNSEGNLANPDPNSEVRWGEQTWEEMMIGWYVRAPYEERKDAAGEDEKQDKSGDSEREGKKVAQADVSTTTN